MKVLLTGEQTTLVLIQQWNCLMLGMGKDVADLVIIDAKPKDSASIYYFDELSCDSIFSSL